MALDSEQVRYDILIEAQHAIKNLQLIMRATEDNQLKIIRFSEIVVAQAKLWGISWQQALNVYKQLNAEFSKQKQATMFGRTGGQDLFSSSEKYITSLQQAGRLTDDLSKKSSNMGKAVESSSHQAVRGLSAVRIAVGVLLSSIAFQLLQAIQNTFQQAIQQARDFEATLYRIANVEKQLSMEGIDVSVKQLKTGINDIKKALPIFSKEDIAQMVGSLATSTKEIGFTGDEILKLGAAISILNINSTETESLLQTQAKVTNSLVSPQARSIGNLGLSFGKAKIEAKALEMGILQTGQSFDDLTEKQKTYIKYSIILETANIDQNESLSELRDEIKKAGGDFEALNAYLESNDAKLAENTAAWHDLQVVIGQIIIPFIPALTSFFSLIRDGFNGAKVVLIEWLTLLGSVATVSRLFFSGHIKDINDFTAALKESVSLLRTDLVNTFFKEMPEDAPEWFKRGWGDLIKEQAETATESIEGLGESVEAFDADGFGNEIEDIIENTQNALEDLDTDLDRKRTDIDTEYQRKSADAWLDYQRKLEDINQDSADKITEIKQKFREDDRERESKYQNELWELQQKYLLDLEDALHERDARQIIRLQKQYAIDKESMERKKNLDTGQSQREMEIDIQQAQNEAKDKREQARLEYERDLQDQQIAKQRELEDLQIWHQRELQDIQTTQQRKLETLIRGWIEEGKITQAGAAQVYSILRGYFGPGGLTDQLYQYMMNSMMSTTSRLPASMSGAPAPYFDLAAASANSLNSGNISGGRTVTSPTKRRGMAEGGTYLARTPQSIDVAEKGPELIQATPIGRLGADINKMFLQSGGKEGLAGAMEIGVTLSPDLEARVINKSLDSVGDIILKVNRTKV